MFTYSQKVEMVRFGVRPAVGEKHGCEPFHTGPDGMDHSCVIFCSMRDDGCASAQTNPA